MPSVQDLAYTVVWTISEYQDKLLTCLAISPNGARMIVASEDRNLLLIDFNDGSVTGVLSFEEQFVVLAAMWYSESNVIVGCSNGSLYDICFDPSSDKCAVSMLPFINPMPEQVRAIAFEPSQNLLAIGYGNIVTIFTRLNSTSKWGQLDWIKGPYNNRSGLVTALVFFPTSSGNRRLLIAYAEAGWTVWSSRGQIERTDSSSNHNVCRIGRATLSADERSIAVSTLDQTIAIYHLGDDGPLLASMTEYPTDAKADWSPIVPVAFTASGLALGGTTSGSVPLIEAQNGEISLIKHEEANHIIRGLATYGNKIVVGSSCDAQSVVKCYSSSVVVKPKRVSGGKATEVFRASLSEALAAWEDGDAKWPAILVDQQGGNKSYMGISHSVWVTVLAVAATFVFVISFDPPGGPTFNEAKKGSSHTGVLKPRLQRHQYWLLFGLSHFTKYFVFQCSSWMMWVCGILYRLIACILQIFPQTLNLILFGISKWMCERVEVYRELGSCPKLEF